MSNQGFVVLFGSAAAGRTPRDLDLVVGGSYSAADAERFAGEWWDRKYGGEAPPVDIHRHADYRDRSVYLLRPTGAETTAIVLAGEAVVRWGDVDSLPAALRLSADGQQDLATAMIARLRRVNGGRIPLSLTSHDRGAGVGVAGGYSGDGPIALEQALARGPLASYDIDQRDFSGSLTELLDAIASNPGIWSGRWWKDGEPALMAGLRRHWQNSSPAGCCGYAGDEDIRFNYAPALKIATVTDILRVIGGAR